MSNGESRADGSAGLDRRIAEDLQVATAGFRFTEEMKRGVLSRIREPVEDGRERFVRRTAVGIAAAAALVMVFNVGLMVAPSAGSQEPDYAVTSLPGSAVVYNQSTAQEGGDEDGD
jgi:hypothetical protein